MLDQQIHQRVLILSFEIGADVVLGYHRGQVSFSWWHLSLIAFKPSQPHGYTVFAKLAISPYRACTRIIQSFAILPKLDPIRLRSLYPCGDHAVLFTETFDVIVGKVLLAAFEGCRTRHAAEIAAVEQ